MLVPQRDAYESAQEKCTLDEMSSIKVALAYFSNSASAKVLSFFFFLRLVGLSLGWTLADLFSHGIQLANSCLYLLQFLSQLPSRCCQGTCFRCSAIWCPALRCGRAGCFDAKRRIQLHRCLAPERRVGPWWEPVLGTAPTALQTLVRDVFYGGLYACQGLTCCAPNFSEGAVSRSNGLVNLCAVLTSESSEVFARFFPQIPSRTMRGSASFGRHNFEKRASLQ